MYHNRKFELFNGSKPLVNCNGEHAFASRTHLSRFKNVLGTLGHIIAVSSNAETFTGFSKLLSSNFKRGSCL